MKLRTLWKNTILTAISALLFSLSAESWAAIDGLEGNTFHFRAKVGRVSTPDGNSLLAWGYAAEGALMQYPGPTLIVKQGETITVTLTNELSVPVSLVFPGQKNVTAVGGSAGLLTQEAPPDGTTTVTYSFVATHPGTYLYQSGTNPELQIEMGMFGALIVRPTNPMQAYNHPETSFVYEHLFLLSEMDPRIHNLVEAGKMNEIDFTDYWPVLWFINGRNAPDTMADPRVAWLPHQPYNSMPRTRPGEKLLMRIINAGRDLHPFHTHGNHHVLIARDGRMLESTSGSGPDLALADFTLKTVPGQTYDALFEWTGKGLGWDIYGHAPDAPLEPNEYAADHGKPIPDLVFPELQSLTFGGMYSGSPFLGALGNLPPGEGGLNLNGGLFFMWHSHTEKEMVNDDIFPGGMMTMVIIEPPGIEIGHEHKGLGKKPSLGRKKRGAK